MEFFAAIDTPLSQPQLQRALTVATLADHCEVIDRVLSHEGEEGEIYCLWGQFKVRREAINGGVRFTLPGCPNALAWTVTADGGKGLVHCTINRAEHDADFIESIELFVDAWARGITAFAA